MKQNNIIIANILLAILLMIIGLKSDIAKAETLHEARLDLNSHGMPSTLHLDQLALLDNKLTVGLKNLDALHTGAQEL